jgi:DnaK suppressor protein
MTLTEKQMAELAAAIEARRDALENELESDVAQAADASPADAADTARDVDELRALEAAAARLAEGSYGVCTECGVPIPFARLKAAPHAARCVECQRRDEKAHPASHPRL